MFVAGDPAKHCGRGYKPRPANANPVPQTKWQPGDKTSGCQETFRTGLQTEMFVAGDPAKHCGRGYKPRPANANPVPQTKWQPGDKTSGCQETFQTGLQTPSGKVTCKIILQIVRNNLQNCLTLKYEPKCKDIVFAIRKFKNTS